MARTKGSRGRGRHAAAKATRSQAEVPDVYTDMLADTVSSPTHVNDEGKTIKRRRIAGRMVIQNNHKPMHGSSDQYLGIGNEKDADESINQIKVAKDQTAYDESGDSAESDMNWEEVDFAHDFKGVDSQDEVDAHNGELNLVLGGDANRIQRESKRKPITAAERNMRLEIHKLHLLSLIKHVHSRNHWCNDEEVHAKLLSLLSNRTVSYLNADDKLSQFQRSRSFIDGLSQASEAFRKEFTIIARGMSRPYWAIGAEALANVNFPRDLELPMEKSDFRLAANKLEASRDVGAQLFCALLRSVGVDARLLCSLQPLPFTATLKGTMQEKPDSAVVTYADSHTASSDENSAVQKSLEDSTTIPRSIESSGGRRRFISNITPRLGQHSSSNLIQEPVPTAPIPFKSKFRSSRIKESPYPIYWVEAFNEATQKWVAVDPLTTQTISKPSKLEPPTSDAKNNLSYVLAFEDDGSARDVTRRYVKAYNAKTRKARVESTKNGEQWWRRVLNIYKRPYDLPRDQIEDSELAAREAAEGMRRNVMDFKDHPYYALERHLKRGEVIHPKREVGKLGVGRAGGNPVLESIFRRRDVHMVKSADSWYRLGREIKIGEQPLKRVPARRNKEPKIDGEEHISDEDISSETPLYAAHQTTLYHPPPITNSRVPKNIYGNLDIYVPSMIPAGGTHIRHPETARAARLLGIDYSDAVTGFSFRGRHGNAIVTGAVVASEYLEAVEGVLEAFENQVVQEEETQRGLEALRLWRKFLAGLRIRERIGGYEIEGEREIEDQMRGKEGEEEGGGFLLDEKSNGPTSGTGSEACFPGSGDEEGGGFLPEDTDYVHEGVSGGGFITEDTANCNQGVMVGQDVNPLPAKRQNKKLRDQDTRGGFLSPEHSPHEKDDARIKDLEHNSSTGGMGTDIETHEPNPEAHNTTRYMITLNNRTPAPIAPNPLESLTPPLPPSISSDLSAAEIAEALLLQQLHESATVETTMAPSYAEPGAGTLATGGTSAFGNWMGKGDSEINVEKSLAPKGIQESSVPEEFRGGSAREEAEKSSALKEAVTMPSNGGTLGNELVENGKGNENIRESEDEEEEEEEDGDDAGSLLSHDPLDEDADPEWLA